MAKYYFSYTKTGLFMLVLTVYIEYVLVSASFPYSSHILKGKKTQTNKQTKNKNNPLYSHLSGLDIRWITVVRIGP